MILALIGRFFLLCEGVKNRCVGAWYKSRFKECGTNVTIGRNSHFVPEHIYIGHDVAIGRSNEFLATLSNIYIGNYVLFGPNVSIRGGDHRLDVIGKHIFEVKENDKLPENDADVHIEDGVWVGGNVVILKGVTIGRGSVIGAGAIVTKSIPPYSIAVGNPARVVKARFSEEQIVEHEKKLNERSV